MGLLKGGKSKAWLAHWFSRYQQQTIIFFVTSHLHVPSMGRKVSEFVCSRGFLDDTSHLGIWYDHSRTRIVTCVTQWKRQPRQQSFAIWKAVNCWRRFKTCISFRWPRMGRSKSQTIFSILVWAANSPLAYPLKENMFFIKTSRRKSAARLTMTMADGG